MWNFANFAPLVRKPSAPASLSFIFLLGEVNVYPQLRYIVHRSAAIEKKPFRLPPPFFFQIEPVTFLFAASFSPKFLNAFVESIGNYLEFRDIPKWFCEDSANCCVGSQNIWTNICTCFRKLPSISSLLAWTPLKCENIQHLWQYSTKVHEQIWDIQGKILWNSTSGERNKHLISNGKERHWEKRKPGLRSRLLRDFNLQPAAVVQL